MVRRATRTVAVALLVLAAAQAHAGGKSPRCTGHSCNDQTQVQGQIQGQQQSAEAAAHAGATATATNTATAEGGHGGDGGQGGAGGSGYGGEATAVNEGVTVNGGGVDVGGDSIEIGGDKVENNSTNVVLVPNNNTSSCMRVWGISFGNHDGAAALGLPFRDEACDLDDAADDAAATGNHKMAWWWRCHKKHIYKTFKQKGDSKAMAHLKCWNSMVEMLNLQSSNNYDENDYLMAQVSEEQLEQVEYRVSQQENLIESLKEDHAEKDAEIERLKREAARLRAEQKQQEDKDAARRAAALKALSKKDEGS